MLSRKEKILRVFDTSSVKQSGSSQFASFSLKMSSSLSFSPCFIVHKQGGNQYITIVPNENQIITSCFLQTIFMLHCPPKPTPNNMTLKVPVLTTIINHMHHTYTQITGLYSITFVLTQYNCETK